MACAKRIAVFMLLMVLIYIELGLGRATIKLGKSHNILDESLFQNALKII